MYQHDNATFSPFLTEGENLFLRDWMMWGSEGHPIQKVKGGWLWTEKHGIKGAPKVYKTKKAAAEAIECYIQILIDRGAGRDC